MFWQCFKKMTTIKRREIYFLTKIIFFVHLLHSAATITETINDHVNNKYYCPQNTESIIDSLVIFIIDAMKTDFVPTIIDQKQNPKWKFLENVAKTNGIGIRIITESPTVTVARTKAILTGFNPSFSDVLWNLNSDRIREDNLVKELYKKDKYRPLYFYGDHTWENFFPAVEPYFGKRLMTSGVNLYDLNGDDKLIANSIRSDLNSDKDWKVLIAHMPGIDRIGHTAGANRQLIESKLQFYDDIAKDIFDYWNKKNRSGLFVLTSDHGMTSDGEHGGSSFDEINAPLLMATNRPISVKNSVINRTYKQIDIAVTLSELLGIDIPNKSEGKLITQVLRTFGLNSQQILCSLNRNVEALHRSLNYDSELLHNDFYQTHFQSQLNEIRRLHEQFLKDSSFGPTAIDAYNKYLEDIQFTYGKRERYGLSTQIILVLGFMTLFILALTFLYYDFKNYSILFFRSNIEISEFHSKKYDKTAPMVSILIQDNENLDEKIKKNFNYNNNNWLESRTIKILAIIPFFIRFASLGSKRFIDNEDLFWDYSGQFFVFLITIFSILNFLNKFNIQVKLCTLYLALMVIIYQYFMINYKDNIMMDLWKSSIQQLLSKQKKSIESFRGFDTLVFMALLSYLVLQMRIHFKRYKNALIQRVFIFWYICIFLYRYKNHNITKIFNGKIIPFRENVYAQMIYVSVACLTIIVLKPEILKICCNIRKSLKCPKLAYLQQSWIVLSAIVLEPKYVPLFVGNIILEELFNQIFKMNSNQSNPSRSTEFVRFLTYLSFAYTSFFQFGNSNSISTLNVTACFTGFDEFITVPCVALTIISIYSGFVFWLTSLIYRLNNNFDSTSYNTTKTNNRECKVGMDRNSYQRQDHQAMFHSLIRLGCAWSLGMFGMMTVVTFVLLDHLLIWTTVLPKYLYELSFTIILLLTWTVIWFSFKCFHIFSLFD